MSAYVIDDVMSFVAAHRALSAATTFCACASFLCLFIAVTTDYWLYTVERVFDGNTTSPAVYLATSSGLWRKCAHKRTSHDLRDIALRLFVKFVYTPQIYGGGALDIWNHTSPT